MKKMNLFWIVSLFIVIGYLFGLYFNLPQTITVELDDSVNQALDKIYIMSENLNTHKINKTGVILNCSIDRYWWCRNGAVFQFTEDYPDKNVIEEDVWEAMEKYCTEATK